MTQHFKLMIHGATTNDGEHKVFAPYDGSLIATANFADKLVVETALENAHSLFRNRDAWLKPSQRIRILEKAARRGNTKKHVQF